MKIRKKTQVPKRKIKKRPATASKIPAELRTQKRWVCNTKTGVPKNALKGYRASCNKQVDWCSFEQASKALKAKDYYSLAFALSEKDNLVGVDLDHCRNPKTRKVEKWATAIVRRLASYTEISPSGTGLRIFVWGTLPKQGRKKGNIEVYDAKKFLSVTGNQTKSLVHLPKSGSRLSQR
ncbi:MAG: hypothetical protein GY847_22295 [Proteobacteria bacterium]|nr:hypothetical protein [Pseudomonadota bacterium]